MWYRVRLWVAFGGLLLLGGSAIAEPRGAVGVEAGVPVAGGTQEILQRGEAYYHYMLSYAYEVYTYRLRKKVDEKHAQAIIEIQKAVKAQPDSAFLHVELAQIRMRQDDMAAALNIGQQAVELDPGSSRVQRH